MAFQRLRSLWRNLMQRSQVDAELSDELASIEQLLYDEHIAKGLSHTEARRIARAGLGGIENVKESVRDSRNSSWLEGVLRDVRYGVRSLRRMPTATATAVLAVTIGIAAATSIFSVVSGVMLRPLPYGTPDQLVTLLHDGANPVSAANYIDWQAQTSSFSSMGAAEAWSPNIAGVGDAERVTALRLTASTFTVLAVNPTIGRVFDDGAEFTGRDREVVLSYNLWQQRFAGDPAVLGRSILLDGGSYEVVGVMPAHFSFAPFWIRHAQLWAPLAIRDKGANRDANSLRVFARLNDGVSLQRARDDVASVTARLEAQFPRTNTDVMVTPLMEHVTAGMRSPLLVLVIAVCFLLAATCANVAHMLLARSSSRQREMAVRLALGASGARLSRQLLIESLLLALTGGALGILLALGATRTVVALAGAAIPRSENIHIDFGVLAVAVGVTVLTGLLFGLAPARNAMRTELVSSLKDGGRSESAGSARASFRSFLVASQFAVAVVLLVGAGLMMRTMAAMQEVDPGLNPRGVVTAEVSVRGAPSETPGARLQFFRQLVANVRALPGVSDASAINHLPLGGDIWGLGITIEPDGGSAPIERASAVYRVALPGYLNTMGIRLLQGRDFDDGDHLQAPAVAIINEQFAKQYFGDGAALGRRFAVNGGDAAPQYMTVVGVVRDVVREQWIEPPAPEMYLPLLQNQSYLELMDGRHAYLTLVARSDGDPATLMRAIRNVVGQLDRGASVSALAPMQSVIDAASADRRFYLFVLAAFAGVALVLAAIGIFGVMSHVVSRRRHEMGVRVALGAAKHDVMQLIVGRGMLVAVAGAAVGIGGALALSRLMTSIVYGVAAIDPLTYVAVTLLLLGVALAACWLPAVRASKVNPVAAMRGE